MELVAPINAEGEVRDRGWGRFDPYVAWEDGTIVSVVVSVATAIFMGCSADDVSTWGAIIGSYVFFLSAANVAEDGFFKVTRVDGAPFRFTRVQRIGIPAVLILYGVIATGVGIVFANVFTEAMYIGRSIADTGCSIIARGKPFGKIVAQSLAQVSFYKMGRFFSQFAFVIGRGWNAETWTAVATVGAAAFVGKGVGIAIGSLTRRVRGIQAVVG